MFEGQVDPIILRIVQGGLLDAATLSFAFFMLLFVGSSNAQKAKRFFSAATGVSLIHGLPMLPLILLVLAGFGSDAAVYAIVHTHRVILGAAGAVALFSILEERH